ncbi:MAG: TIGR03118 family protein [Bryobacteraceae bacterium]
MEPERAAPSTLHSSAIGATGTTPSAYTGIALGTISGTQYLYAANGAAGRVDVYDRTFTDVTATSFAGKFVDPNPVAGLVPFNIANINGELYVSYTPASPVVVGFGVINIFDTAGNFVKRFATGDPTVPLYDPWGMVVAPPDFGDFSNALLVGDFNLGNGAASPPAGGPGYILAFSLATGADNGRFLGLLNGTDSKPVSIDGLWSLILGNGHSGGNPSDLYFSAGINGQANGLFGSLSTCHGPVISNASASPNVLWPPNNKFVPVTIGYAVTDDCDPAPSCSLSVTAEDSGGGINNTADSSVVVDANMVELLASRNGGGNGRVYTVQISCKDKLPLSSSANVAVTVPHDKGQGGPATATLTASPNPIAPAPGSFLGRTTLSWNAPSSSSVEIMVGSSGGTLFAEGGSTGSAQTGAWVDNGMQFFLLDATSHSVLAETTATFNQSVGTVSLTATPNPVNPAVQAGLGQTTLTWSAPGSDDVELRVGSATGPLFAIGGSTGTAQTGIWVSNGLQFFLVDGNSRQTLASTTVTLTSPSSPILTLGPAANSAVWQTTVTWDAPGSTGVEIHIGSATGTLFAASGSAGSAQTGMWVFKGMVFVLVDSTTHLPIISVTA